MWDKDPIFLFDVQKSFLQFNHGNYLFRGDQDQYVLQTKNSDARCLTKADYLPIIGQKCSATVLCDGEALCLAKVNRTLK